MPSSLTMALERRVEFGAIDIGHADRLGIGVVQHPGRMRGGGAPIALRQAAPGDETHHTIGYRSAGSRRGAMHRVHDRVQRRFIDGFDRLRAIEPVGEAIERRLLVGAPGHDRFRALARGHVAGNLRSADDGAVLVPHWRHGERNINQPPVLAATNGLVVFDARAGPDATQDLRFLAPEMIGNDRGDRLADHFFGGISEQALGARIPADDASVEILADDGVVGGFYDAGELPARLFAAALIGDVKERGDPAFDIPGGIEFGPVGDGEPADAAVRKFQIAFEIRPTLRSTPHRYRAAGCADRVGQLLRRCFCR